MRIKTMIAAAAIAVSTTAIAADMKPAVIYDMGGKFDKSFNEGVYNGVKKFTDETGIEVMEFEVTNETQREQAMRRMAERGATIVLGVGFAQADAISKVAAEFPDTKFSIIDVSWLDAPNLRQYAFKEHEGSYIVGVAAAKASKTGKVGFVGGMDIPLIRKFQGGYEQGALYVNPDINILANMTGSTPEAWNNPTKGAELTKAQIDGGADVVYQAAGGTGIGVLQAAADAGIMGIGVDTNQNWMHPGNMLTSMLKRLDLTIFEQAQKTEAGTFESGIHILGLAEGMVGYATEDGMVTSAMESAVAAAAADIVSGSMEVADWSQE